ncbi:MAG TPA: TolC family protein [Alphaproteobacteria bacterium]|nr:TolC family protein [Alphaproteobacteria bacterium]
MAAVLLALPVLGCALQSYRPQPLEPARIATELGARRSDDQGLRAFMERHGDAVAQWPPQQWDLAALTLMAVYFHPDMEVARANLEVQRAAAITAGQRPNPRGGPLLEHHTGQGTVDSPWSIGLGLDIPIELGGKRDARIARAEQLSEEARLSIAETAWRVRSRLRQRFVEAFAADATSALLKRELDIRSQEVAMLERREKAGEASPSEVTLARLRLQETRLAVDGADGNIRAGRASLAEALGLPFDRIEGMPLGFDKLASGEFGTLPAETAQKAALQNRLDLRQGLARYAAAEATLREEIARQYPDLNLSPGLLWDQGDWVKSLGAMILLPILNSNEGPIAEAEAKRKLEAARFTSLEAGVFAGLSTARVRFEAALNSWNTAKGLVAQQSRRLEDVKKLIAYGEADRLSLVEAEIELIAAQRAELKAKIDALRAWGGVEDAVQRPLDADALPEDLGVTNAPPAEPKRDGAAK